MANVSGIKINYALLKSTREKLGITQKAMAEKIGVSRVSMSMYETGDQSPTQEMLEKIAAAYQMPVEELTRGVSYDLMDGLVSVYEKACDNDIMISGQVLDDDDRQYVMHLLELVVVTLERVYDRETDQ